MSARTRLVAMILALAVVLTSSSPAGTQTSRPPRDPALIQKKLQRSAELQRQAMQALGDRPRAEKLVERAWTELKSASDDMIINASNMKYPDPLFGANNRRVDQALGLLLGAWDAVKRRDQWTGEEGQVQGVRTNLEQALRLTNTVAVSTY